MRREKIDVERLVFQPVDIWGNDGLLLAAGDFSKGRYNCMTVGWGGFGMMWSKPLVMVVVRPTRHTYQLMESFDSFTLCAFSSQHAEALAYCGSHSGRDGDKVKACGLTPIASRSVASPGFDEAELILECRKMYSDDLDPKRFLDDSIHGMYPLKDYHRMYFGEILAASGTAAYKGAERP